MEPVPRNQAPAAPQDAATTVLSRLPTTKGDVGAFLVSYGVGYIVVDVFAAGLGLPPPITTAAMASAVVVGIKSPLKPFSTDHGVQARSDRFEELLHDDVNYGGGQTATRVAHLRRRLFRARRLWENDIDDDAEYEQSLNELIAEYKAAHGLVNTEKGT